MPAYGDILGRLKIAILRDRLQNGNHHVEERLRKIRDHGLQSPDSCRHYGTDPHH